MPLYDHEGNSVGVLQVLNKRQGGFARYDIDLAEALGAQAGVSLQRARLIEYYIKQQEMERAMKIARDIQRRLLPLDSPAICGFDIAGFSEPADDTGGDTYDFLALPDGRWLLGVADASGHGIGSAIVITETRAMLRATSFQGCEVSDVLGTVNRLLTYDLLEGRFVTCFLGVLDPLQASLTYASAGQGPIVFYDRKRDEFAQLPATALPLGIVPEFDMLETAPYQFHPGDFAAVTTDGFFEAENGAGERFGLQRMMALFRRDRELPAQQMIANLYDAVTEFRGEVPQSDDLTAIVIRRK